MNVFHKVTLASLKKNRTRTAVTVIGIALSTALMTAVTTSVSSLHHFLIEDEIRRSGRWQGSFHSLTAEQYEGLAGDEQIGEITGTQTIGYAQVPSENEYKPYLYLMGVGENFTDLVSINLLSGELPENETEILLPEHLSTNGGVYYEVGDTLTLDIGDRMIDGCPLDQVNPFIPAEELGEDETPEIFSVRETRTYTVCGIYERPDFEEFTAPGYTCLTLSDDAPCDAMGAWFTFKQPSQIIDFMNETEFSGTTHSHLLRLMGVSNNENYLNVIYAMAAVLIGLIVFGSVSLIYNAFAISISERTKQFGLLSSIGATRRQLRYMVRFEAYCVSALGIPIGLLVGIAGIMVTLLCIGGKFAMIANSDTPMRLHVSWVALVTAVAVSLVTVLISVWIPSRRASRVSAVEAIRQSADIRAGRRSLKTPGWICKVFGLSGMLGHKYFTRSRKKYRATILSLFMSVVLFISASAFTDYLQASVIGVYGDDTGDLYFYLYRHELGEHTPESLTALFETEPHVTSCTCQTASSVYGAIPSSELAADAQTLAHHLFVPDYDTPEGDGVYAYVMFVDDDTYRAFLRENGLSEAQFMNAENPQAVAFDHVTSYREDNHKYADFDLLTGDTCTMHAMLMREYEGYRFMNWNDGKDVATYQKDDIGARYDPEEDDMHVLYTDACIERDLYAGAVVHEKPSFFNSSGIPYFFYPMSLMDTVLDGAEKPDYVMFWMTAPEHAAAEEGLRTMITEQHLPSSNLYDYAADRENERNLVTIIKVFSYGFIVLISLIAAANVFNSISTNVALRRREFAMLRSIGMTNRSLLRMMHYECILYGTRALLFGLPVSAGVTVLIWMAVHEGFETGFRLPWTAMLVAVCSVFAVVFASMLYAMQKLRRDNTIDALKNENL